MEPPPLLEPKTIETNLEAGRDGSWVAQNEPRALEMFTTTGFSDCCSSGSAASVARTMPTAFVSKTSRTLGPSSASLMLAPLARLAMPALLTRTSSPVPESAIVAKAAATEASSVTSSWTNRAPSSSAAARPRASSRAPIHTVWRASTRSRAVSLPRPLFAPVMSVVVMRQWSPACERIGSRPLFVGLAGPGQRVLTGLILGGWKLGVRQSSAPLARAHRAAVRRPPGRRSPSRGWPPPRGACRARRHLRRLPDSTRAGARDLALGADRRGARPELAALRRRARSPLPARGPGRARPGYRSGADHAQRSATPRPLGGRGHDAGGDADGAVVGVLQGVPSVGDEFADLVRHYRFESGGDADRFRGEGVHGFPDARELS